MNFLIGQIVPFAGNFAPQGWMLCQGQILPISQYTQLFSILGTMYGGNGTTNFQLPDLRGAVAISKGAAPGRSSYDVGETGGAEHASLTINEMPMHTHTANVSVAINVSDQRANKSSPIDGVLAQTSDATVYASDVDSSTVMATAAVTVSGTAAATGGNLPFPTLSPFLAVNYCICINGIFPQRP